MKESIRAIFDELYTRYPALTACKADIEGAAQLMIEGFESGHKLLTCGNGGSASDAEHIVGELMKAFVLPRKLSSEMVEKLGDPYLSDNLQGALPAVPPISMSILSP